MRDLPATEMFNRAEARELGWSDAALTRAARSGRILRVRRGLFSVAGEVDPVTAARAAARQCGGSVISHRSAALAHGLPLLHPPPRRPDLTVAPRRTGDVSAALLHRATLLPDDVMLLAGLPTTTVARTAIDLARTVSIVASVVTMDAALHRGLTHQDELESVLRRCANWPGIRKAIRAVALTDAAAESPLESVSRLVIVNRLRLPAPRSQAVILDEHGNFIGRCDFYWDEFGVFGEADGRDKYSGREILTGEKLRQEDLENLGLVAVRWGWRDVRYDQPVLRRRIVDAFERGRLRDASGFPRKWSVQSRQTEQ